MTTKKPENQILTRAYFERRLSELVTKEYLDWEMGRRFAEVDKRFNEITTTLDAVIKMFEDWRIENSVAKAQEDRNEKLLINHEGRLTALETKFV